MTDTVVEEDAFDPPHRLSATVAATAEQLAGVSQEGRLADATGHADDLVLAHEIGEAVPERSPDLDRVPGFHLHEEPSHLADDQVDDVEPGRGAARVRHRVVQREGPAQERVVLGRQSEHDELTRPDRGRDLRAVQANAIGAFGELDVLNGAGGALEDYASPGSVGTDLRSVRAFGDGNCCGWSGALIGTDRRSVPTGFLVRVTTLRRASISGRASLRDLPLGSRSSRTGPIATRRSRMTL